MTLPGRPPQRRPARPRSSRAGVVPRPLPYRGRGRPATSSQVVPEPDPQLELFDRWDDGLTFGKWMESLPCDQARKR